MFKSKIGIVPFVAFLSILNGIFFHFPFFKFVFANIDTKSVNGILLIISLFVLLIVANGFAFLLFMFISKYLGKFLLVLSFLLSSVAIYFVNTYGVIIDESMIGNVFNTKYSEASSFFSWAMAGYVFFLGILPSLYIIKADILKISAKNFFKIIGVSLAFILVVVFANSSNFLWIDKNSKRLGGLAMPWSYYVNTSLLFIHQHQKNRSEIPLPNGHFKDNKKTVVVLVIGESARKANFSLYGYGRNTNPYLSSTPNVFHFNATSCATYTTAGVKCILEPHSSDDLFETLPNYLYRSDAEVIWRTSNWGEPPLHIKNYKNADYLKTLCTGEQCNHDEVLLAGLKEQILASKKNKILVILHTSTSHGPSYNTRYPKKFETFKPACSSVELAKCTQQELVNAYDNTVVYTDYLLKRVIENLHQLPDYQSSMIFVSDHGESLGEKNLYMHGVPRSFAPKEQYEIPFIVWVSDGSKTLKPEKEINQGYVFHSVLNFMGFQSPVYNENLNIFK